jgi:PhnB protein
MPALYLFQKGTMNMAKKAKTRKKTATKAKRKPVKAQKKMTKKSTKKVKKVQKSKKASRTTSRKKKVAAIPRGYTAVTPYLIVDNAGDAINFYKAAFSAKETMRFAKPDGKISHAELIIGDAKVMLADAHPEMNARDPKDIGGSPVGIHLYVKNVDSVVNEALAAGASLIRPVETMFYGDRTGSITDPYGHHWHVSTHVEDVSASETKKRAAALYSE